MLLICPCLGQHVSVRKHRRRSAKAQAVFCTLLPGCALESIIAPNGGIAVDREAGSVGGKVQDICAMGRDGALAAECVEVPDSDGRIPASRQQQVPSCPCAGLSFVRPMVPVMASLNSVC
jgi:hypothetical protein